MKIEVLKGSKTSRETIDYDIHACLYKNPMVDRFNFLYFSYLLWIPNMLLLSLYYYEVQPNFDEWNNIYSSHTFSLGTLSRTLAYDLHISNTDPQ